VQISISARHGDLSVSTQETIEAKVRKLTRFFDRLTSIQVTVDLEREDSKSIEIKASAEHTDDFVATDEGVNVLTALDSVLAKVEIQLKKHKEKRTGHRNSGHKYIETPQD